MKSGIYHSANLYSGANVVVLGATGFIGRWVARKLCDHGARLHLVIRDESAAKEVFSRHAIEGKAIALDLEDFDAVRDMFHDIKPSITFNLAGYGVDHSEQDEDMAHTINARLVRTICESISEQCDPEWPGQDIVHVGSAGEYGAIAGNFCEDSVPNPTTIYGKSKLEGTKILASLCNAIDIKGLTVRPFTVYGSGEHKKRLLPSLMETARTGKPMRLTAGNQKRDFVYVEDVAEGLLRLGVSAARPGDAVNLATGQSNSVRSFVRATAKIFQIPDECLEFGTMSMRDEEKEWSIENTPVTVQRLLSLTGWKPETNIEDGLRRTLAFENACSY